MSLSLLMSAFFAIVGSAVTVVGLLGAHGARKNNTEPVLFLVLCGGVVVIGVAVLIVSLFSLEPTARPWVGIGSGIVAALVGWSFAREPRRSRPNPSQDVRKAHRHRPSNSGRADDIR